MTLAKGLIYVGIAIMLMSIGFIMTGCSRYDNSGFILTNAVIYDHAHHAQTKE